MSQMSAALNKARIFHSLIQERILKIVIYCSKYDDTFRLAASQPLHAQGSIILQRGVENIHRHGLATAHTAVPFPRLWGRGCMVPVHIWEYQGIASVQ